jgi:hypothetical protein
MESVSGKAGAHEVERVWFDEGEGQSSAKIPRGRGRAGSGGSGWVAVKQRGQSCWRGWLEEVVAWQDHQIQTLASTSCPVSWTCMTEDTEFSA